jgi:ubiquinol-cytochrome c reductase iron-sulfur subunit
MRQAPRSGARRGFRTPEVGKVLTLSTAKSGRGAWRDRDRKSRLANARPHVYQARQAAQGRLAPLGAALRGLFLFRVFLFEALKDIMATVEHSDGTPAAGPDGTMRRRDFINIAAVSVAGVGAAVTLYPLVNQMNPSADVLALASIEVDLAAIQPGQSIKTVFRKQPLFVRHLTPAEIQAANAVPVGELRDPQTLAERTKEGKPQWLITMGVCTHLGCVPLGAAEGENKGQFGGYFCPCHGSHYDTAARIRKGPAPKNLEVPDYAFKSDTVVAIGEVA